MNQKEEQNLKKELLEIFELIQKIRKEVASITYPTNHIQEAFAQLDAIVSSTAMATDEIISNTEKINKIAKETKNDELFELSSNILVSCSFQDITGQRITKISKSLKYIEDKINTLVTFWGKNFLQQTHLDNKEHTDNDQQFINGPALPGQGLNQTQADEIFKAVAINKDISAGKTSSSPEQTTPIIKENKEEKTEAPNEPQEDKTLDQSDIDNLFR